MTRVGYDTAQVFIINIRRPYLNVIKILRRASQGFDGPVTDGIEQHGRPRVRLFQAPDEGGKETNLPLDFFDTDAATTDLAVEALLTPAV